MLDLADVLKAAARKMEAVIATDYCLLYSGVHILLAM